MDVINNFFTFLTDRNYRVSHKATMIFSILFLFIIADNITGFSYYYNNQNKIEQVSEISILLKNPSLDENSQKELKRLRTEILNHKSLKDITYNLLSNISFDQEVKQSSKHSVTPTKVISEEIQRNYYWHFISSSWMWLILMIALPFAALTDKTQSLAQNFLLLIFVEAAMWIFAWLQAKLFSFIPIINDTPLFNYLTNLLITAIIIFVIYKRSKKN